MIPSAMVVEIQAHGFDDILDTRIYPLLTSENRRLCGIFPWPFTEKFFSWTEAAVPSNAGTPLTGAPTDIRAVRALGMPAIADNAGNVTYLPRDLISKTYGYNSYLISDFPRHYNIWGKNSSGGGQLFVYPYFTANTLFALDYHMLPPVLSAGSTEAQMLLPDEYAPILMDRVLARLSRSEGDLQDGDTYDRRAASALQDMLDAFDVNMDSPPPMIFTDSEDSWFG